MNSLRRSNKILLIFRRFFFFDTWRFDGAFQGHQDSQEKQFEKTNTIKCAALEH